MFKFGVIGAGGFSSRFCKAIKYTDCAYVDAIASKSINRAKSFAEPNDVE